jgi:hypothetical protein
MQLVLGGLVFFCGVGDMCTVCFRAISSLQRTAWLCGMRIWIFFDHVGLSSLNGMFVNVFRGIVPTSSRCDGVHFLRGRAIPTKYWSEHMCRVPHRNLLSHRWRHFFVRLRFLRCGHLSSPNGSDLLCSLSGGNLLERFRDAELCELRCLRRR